MEKPACNPLQRVSSTSREFIHGGLLPKLEENGWRIAGAARRIWAGERDPEALTAGLDEQDSALVRRALELLIDDVPPPGG